MPDAFGSLPFAPLLETATREVLETMFFTSVFGLSPEPVPEPRFNVRIVFSGSPPGVFRMSVSSTTARSIAANFLGAEREADVNEAQTGNVIRELANVICGHTLSRLESGATFELGSPELVAVSEAPPDSCVLMSEHGMLAVSLSMADQA